jgi:carbamoyltransferase
MNDDWVNESSVSILENGKLVGCIAEERLSRVKVDGRFPTSSINDVLSRAGLNIQDVDHLAVTSLHPTYNGKKYFSSALTTFGDTGVFLSKKIRQFGWYYLYNYLKTPKELYYTILGRQFKINHHEHHLCHAAGAYYCAPFDNALIITLDGGGDGLDGVAMYGLEGKLTTLFEVPHFQSPGTMYSAITHDLGFKRHRHEGKITGLAAYGNPNLKRLGIENLIKYNKRKHRFVSRQIAAHHRNLLAKSEYFAPLLAKFSKEDVAAGAQELFEKVVLEFVRDAFEYAAVRGFKPRNICLAGGCFANVKLNQKVFDLKLFKDIYVFPAMGDDGLSAGAALLDYYGRNPSADKNMSCLSHVYLGGAFTDSMIEDSLRNAGMKFQMHNEVEVEIGKLLAEGKVVARFNGRMEYGPRALGNRSVIASASDKSINDWLNKKFHRTEFMPFAPSMLQEYASEYLENYNGESAADFMTITYNIRPGMAEKIPAVVHVDNTARPQIVRKAANPSYHKIISEYYARTGIPVVLNTSFNMHEEPIVYTPQDAIRGFLDAKLDVLAIGDYIVEAPK